MAEEWDPKPDDEKTWWLSSHCGPGTLDGNKNCGFCGKKHIECAKANTEAIKNGKVHCGGSGFWCPHCGLFWAQNACGEDSWSTHENVDEEKHLVLKDDGVYCYCGAKLFEEDM